MTARVIAVVNQKGGAGKTTLAMQLAGTLARHEVKLMAHRSPKFGVKSKITLSSGYE